MNLAELAIRRAQESGDAFAVRMAGRSLTYRELVEASDRVASGLRERGVGFGDRVMMFAENSVEHLVTYLATARLGAIFTPIHPSLQVSELHYFLADSTPRAVIAEAALWDRLERTESDHLPNVAIVLDAPYGDLPLFNELERAAGSVGVEQVQDHDPVLICYTSGTTERPRPVTRSHANEIWNATKYAEVWGHKTEDCALVTLPLSWLWGLSTLAVSLLSVGASIVLHAGFDPDNVLDEIDASNVSLYAGTMSMYTAIIDAFDHRQRNLSSLRHLYCGGEPINLEVVMALETRMGVTLIDAYATTEVAPVLAIDPAQDIDCARRTVGRLLTGSEVRIVDDSGHDVRRGEVGEGWLGARGAMLRYWNEPEETAKRMTSDGWFRSGDLLLEGEEGYYFLIGRTADIIIRNGAKIAPAELEAALASLDGVADSVAVGVPDHETGESIVAYIQRNRGCIVSADDVYDQLSDRIARFKLPSHIEFVDELPVGRNRTRDRTTVFRLVTNNKIELESTVGLREFMKAPAINGQSHLRLVK